MQIVVYEPSLRRTEMWLPGDGIQEVPKHVADCVLSCSHFSACKVGSQNRCSIPGKANKYLDVLENNEKGCRARLALSLLAVKGKTLKLTSNLRILSTLRKGGAVLPFSNIPLRRARNQLSPQHTFLCQDGKFKRECYMVVMLVLNKSTKLKHVTTRYETTRRMKPVIWLKKHEPTHSYVI
jgi:hypothetical protein